MIAWTAGSTWIALVLFFGGALGLLVLLLRQYAYGCYRAGYDDGWKDYLAGQVVTDTAREDAATGA